MRSKNDRNQLGHLCSAVRVVISFVSYKENKKIECQISLSTFVVQSRLFSVLYEKDEIIEWLKSACASS